MKKEKVSKIWSKRELHMVLGKKVPLWKRTSGIST